MQGYRDHHNLSVSAISEFSSKAGLCSAILKMMLLVQEKLGMVQLRRGGLCCGQAALSCQEPFFSVRLAFFDDYGSIAHATHGSFNSASKATA